MYSAYAWERVFSDSANRMKPTRERATGVADMGNKGEVKCNTEVFDYTGGLNLVITYLNRTKLFCWEKKLKEKWIYLSLDFHVSVLHKLFWGTELLCLFLAKFVNYIALFTCTACQGLEVDTGVQTAGIF